MKRSRRTARSVTTHGDTDARDDSRAAGSFPIVGIGASAGGLEAFSALLKHLPRDTGMGSCSCSISIRCTTARSRSCSGARRPSQSTR